METWMGKVSILWSEVYSMTYEQAASVLKMELSKCRNDFYSDRRKALQLAIFTLECFSQRKTAEVDFFDMKPEEEWLYEQILQGK